MRWFKNTSVERETVNYLSERLHKAETERQDAEKLAAATEAAAIKIIGRYDPNAVNEFQLLRDQIKLHY